MSNTGDFTFVNHLLMLWMWRGLKKKKWFKQKTKLQYIFSETSWGNSQVNIEKCFYPKEVLVMLTDFYRISHFRADLTR